MIRAALILIVAFWAGTAAALNYHALLIANSDYTDPGWPDLATPARDVEALDSVLSDRYGFETQVLRDVSTRAIIDAIEGYRARLGEDDSLLIYYAGHGSLIDGIGGYWVGVDASTTSRSGWLKYDIIDDLIDYRSGMKARHVLVVADSCYSGAALRSRGAFGQPPGGNWEDMLARLASKRSRTVLTSGGTEPVIDSIGDTPHSVFATEFIDTLKSNGGILDTHSLFQKIQPEVYGRAQRALGAAAQAPEYGQVNGVGHDGGDFLFVPAGMPLPQVRDDRRESGGFGLRGDGTGAIRRLQTTLLHDASATVHLGDENIRSWAPVSGQCYPISVDLPQGTEVQSFEISYEAYGAEATYVEFLGQRRANPAMISRVGETRPNYWSASQVQSFYFSEPRVMPGRVTMQICSDRVPNPEFPGDLDDLQIRNVRLWANHY